MREVVEGREQPSLQDVLDAAPAQPRNIEELSAVTRRRASAAVTHSVTLLRRCFDPFAKDLTFALAQRQQRTKGRKVADASFARQILARGRNPVIVAGVRALADARVQLRRYACDPTVCLLLYAVASREAGLPLTPEQEAGLEHLGEILAAPDRRTAPPPRTETDLPVMRLDDAMQLHRMHEAGELQRIGSPGN